MVEIINEGRRGGISLGDMAEILLFFSLGLLPLADTK
jgi:hypothetical protein